MKGTRYISFICGVIIGAAVFGGSVAVAACIIAQPKTAGVVIDGKTVDLKGYLIDGSHYFQLRDLEEKLVPSGKDFSVVWDGENNRIIIDTNRRYDADEKLPVPGTEQEPVMSVEEMRMEIIRLTNAERARAGVPELIVLPALMECAQAKAQDFLDNRYFGHTSPVYGTPTQMIRSYIPNIRTCGENLATWVTTPEAAFSGWLDSPEHLQNMLATKFTHIGVGIVVDKDGGMCWVQQLAGF